MTYMGSKSKYTPYIVPILQKCIDSHNLDTYIEPFCGGCSLIKQVKCDNKLAYDASDTLIALLQQTKDNFDGVLKAGTRELWDKGKAYRKDGVMPDDMTLAEIGAMEFLGSFNNGGFARGYAKPAKGRDFYNEAYRNLAADVPYLQDITFKHQYYWDLDPATRNACILCDPPYAGTKQYGYARQGTFDNAKFWDWVREISKTNYVFVCEQTAPDDFVAVWEQEVRRTCNADNNYKATEHLFTLKGGLADEHN